MLPLPMLWVIRSTVLPMHSLNSLGSLPAAAHSSVSQQSDHHIVSKRRCTSPVASKNDEGGTSRFAESSVPSLRIRCCRNPSLAASEVEQGAAYQIFFRGIQIFKLKSSSWLLVGWWLLYLRLSKEFKSLILL